MPSLAVSDEQSIAHRAWNALHARAIPPTPRSFEVFYTSFSGTNRALADRVSTLETSGQPLTAQQVEELYRAYIQGTDEAGAVDADAEEIAEAAQNIVAQISDNREALRQYGGALDHWSGNLNAGSGIDGLMRAVAALTAETARASARNRELEAQLSTSVVRISRLRHDLVQVRQEATTDALTGIANRRAFDARLRRAIRHAQTDTSTPFSLLLLDVDHFKRFNDAHGHRTGDHVLRLIARLLADNVKGRDTAARFGGEEFAVLLAGADLKAATSVARQICERLAAQRLIKRGTGEPVGQITASIGVAQHRAGESGAALIERADAALYEAKNAGRNRVCAEPERDLPIA
ncbi:hypothetical protein ADL19_05700 [Streptomyces purpurogeneiscleroticus]|nr:hypothetical protein ADL19_05700 [Streptomyces purpurogeneiscleroticus]